MTTTFTAAAIPRGIEAAKRRPSAAGRNTTQFNRLREPSMELSVERLLSANPAANTLGEA